MPRLPAAIAGAALRWLRHDECEHVQRGMRSVRVCGCMHEKEALVAAPWPDYRRLFADISPVCRSPSCKRMRGKTTAMFRPKSAIQLAVLDAPKARFVAWVAGMGCANGGLGLS